MIESQKEKIILLRKEGHSYNKIANLMAVSENTIKSFFRRAERNCKNCRKKLKKAEKCKPKMFCTDRCRINFWRKNKKRRDSLDFNTGPI